MTSNDLTLVLQGFEQLGYTVIYYITSMMFKLPIVNVNSLTNDVLKIMTTDEIQKLSVDQVKTLSSEILLNNYNYILNYTTESSTSLYQCFL